MVTTRTRQNPRKKRQYENESCSDEGRSYSEGDDSLSTDVSTGSEVVVDEDECTRLIVELEPLLDLVERNMKCPECGSSVQMLHETITLASMFRLECLSEKCNFIDYASSLAPAKLSHLQEDNRPRNTDYAINVLYVLATIANGDGPTEAGKLLGFLGLPRPSTMDSSNFATIEERIAPVIWKLHETIMHDNLKKEVAATVSSNDYHIWQQSMDPLSPISLEKSAYPQIRGSYDTGWNQRSSGKVYNSPSSHSFLVGAKTQLPVEGEVLSKVCAFHEAWERKIALGKAAAGTPCPTHHCVMNFDPNSSSGSMEPFACAKIVNRLHNKWQTNVELICMDDDASTRTALKWSNTDHMKNNNTEEVPKVKVNTKDGSVKWKDRPDKGQLEGHVPEPGTTADPNHRRKVLTGDLLALATAKGEAKLTMTKMDVTRLGKNYGYMIRRLRNLKEDQYCFAANAVLEHHFDNHEYCGSWCHRTRMTPEQIASSKRFYRCKVKDAKLYHKLESIMSRFVSLERLKEVAHGMDTNVNASINNTVSYFAPKNRVYCKSRLLQNRVAMATGVVSLGFSQYFLRLFKDLGIQVTPAIRHYIQQKQKQRSFRLHKQKLTATKKKRKEAKFRNLIEEEDKAIRQRLKRDGAYATGANMKPEGFDDGDKKTRATSSNTICPHCGLKGHKTTRSKKCRANPTNKNYNPNLLPENVHSIPNQAAMPPESALEELEQEDIDKLDQMPFTDDGPGIDYEADEFRDPLTWSDKDDSNPQTHGFL